MTATEKCGAQHPTEPDVRCENEKGHRGSHIGFRVPAADTPNLQIGTAVDIGMLQWDDDNEPAREELANMAHNTGRFGIQGSADRWQVVDLSELPPKPMTDWMTHAEAMAERDKLFRRA